jgi:hypothetical protein
MQGFSLYSQISTGQGRTESSDGDGFSTTTRSQTPSSEYLPTLSLSTNGDPRPCCVRCAQLYKDYPSVPLSLPILFHPTNQGRQLRCDPYFEDRKPRKGITHAVSKGCHDCRARHRKCDVVSMVVVDVSVSYVELTCVSDSGTCPFLHSTQGAAALCRCLSRRPGETRPK